MIEHYVPKKVGQFPLMRTGQAVIDVTLDPADTNAATTDSWVRAVESAAKYAERHGYRRTADRSTHAVSAWCTQTTTANLEVWRVMIAVERHPALIGTAIEHSIEDPFTGQSTARVRLNDMTDAPGATEVTT